MNLSIARKLSVADSFPSRELISRLELYQIQEGNVITDYTGKEWVALRPASKLGTLLMGTRYGEDAIKCGTVSFNSVQLQEGSVNVKDALVSNSIYSLRSRNPKHVEAYKAYSKLMETVGR